MLERGEIVDNIVLRGALKQQTKTWLDGFVSRRYPVVSEACEPLFAINPGFHFTSESFTAHYKDAGQRDRIISASDRLHWNVDQQDLGSVRITTGNVDNICKNGFKEMTCIASMPEGDSAEIMRLHPKLFFLGTRRLVEQFGKHALPYKMLVLQQKGVVLSDFSSAVVVIGDKSKRKKKGSIDRPVLLSRNLLRGATHFLTEGAENSDILGVARFDFFSTATCEQGTLRCDEAALTQAVYSGLWKAFPDIIEAASKRLQLQDPDRVARAVALLSSFSR